MNLKATRGVSILLMSFFLLLLFVPLTVSLAQDINPQAIISGSIQQGDWYEQWNQPGTMYCPNNTQRFITATSEHFRLTAPAGEQTISIYYETSRITLYLVRASNGNYVYSNESSWWVHLLEVTRLSATQMSVYSTYYAKDGNCTLNNFATWSFSSAPPVPTTPPQNQTCIVTPVSVVVNKRSGPGLNYAILGQLLPYTSAIVINVSYDTQGRRWWFLADNTWVSGVVTIATGNCPN